MDYLSWNQQTISDFSDAHVCGMYSEGYVFTRIGKGVMQQTRSVRINLSKFEPSSENRRILRKVPLDLASEPADPLSAYDFRLGKLAKDFYDEKFGPGIMSAQKVKEMLTDPDKSNFNCLISFSLNTIPPEERATMPPRAAPPCGFAICFANPVILHYSYPFYDLKKCPKDTGLGMMVRAIEWAKAEGKKYVYLGSLQRVTDSYKLQFAGLEWFDGGPSGSGIWQTDIETAKGTLRTLRTLKTL